MAANVTYNGVAGAEGGNIFKDVSFWVAQRVPTRDTILGHIRNNGGVVVALEKEADILIADHARKDAPAGSCSWKFVTESVQHGIIQLEDRYRIGPAPGVPRQTGSSRPTRSTRTPFTHADDVALAKWVLSHGRYLTGNKMYQELETMNPRHTWQSWRDRYVKSLMSRGQHYLEQLASEELPEGDEGAMQDAPENANQTVDSRTGARGAAASAPATRAAATKARSAAKQKDAENEQLRPYSRLLETDMDAGSERREASPRVLETPKDVASEVPDPSRAPETREDDAIDQFYSDLNCFVAASGAEIEMEHHIGGKTIDLWQLSQAVGAQEVPVDEVDWIRVAEDLGYDWDQDNYVSVALQQCYEDNLADFIETMSSFGQEDDQGPDERQQAPLHVSSSSPAQVIGKKRPRDIQQPSPGCAKRRRLSRDAEIPSTPDEKIGYPARPPASSTLSPSVQRSIMRPGQTQRIDASQQLPPLPRPRRGRHETEAEKIVFETQIQPPARLETQQSSFDVTPSQQLRSEELDAQPIPLDLKRGRSDADRRRETETPRPRDTRNASASTPTQAKTQPSRRSLPVSFRSSAGPARQVESPQQEPRPARQNQDPGKRGTSNQQKIREVVEDYALEYPHRIVVDALKRTTMVPGVLAAVVMQSLRDGKGVPTHYEGIWTDRDDESLRLVDSAHADKPPGERRKAKKEFDRLVAKHGLNQIELRRLFLAASGR